MFKFPSSWSLCVGVYQVVKQIMNKQQWITTTSWARLATNWVPTIVQIGLVTNRIEPALRFNNQHVNKSPSCNRSPIHPSISLKILANKVGFISSLCF
jgi:hypothetical protein